MFKFLKKEISSNTPRIIVKQKKIILIKKNFDKKITNYIFLINFKHFLPFYRKLCKQNKKTNNGNMK